MIKEYKKNIVKCHNCSTLWTFSDEDVKEVERNNQFGDNYKDAFKTLRTALLNLLKDGAKKDYTAIKNNPINSSIKAKILAMYYPDKYMNVYSLKHLDYYLTTLGLNTKELMKSDVLYKREALVDFKNEDDDMKNWSNYVFSIFLWAHYPKDPRCVTDF